MVVYPAVFSPCQEGGYHVWFPDVPGVHTEGNDTAEAIRMARDALLMVLDCMTDDGTPLPAASAMDGVITSDGEFVSMIDADIDAYRRKKDSRAVKKTVSLPAWLNTMAEDAGLSYSQILQDALTSRLGVPPIR